MNYIIPIFLKLGRAPDRGSGGFGPSWGFSLFGGALHLNWGEKTRIIYPPWGIKHLRSEILMADGSWRDVRHGKEGQWRATDVPFFYRTRACERQDGTATLTVERAVYCGKLFPFRRKVYTSIDVEFGCEVGNQRGTWKGGTIGCGYNLKPGETPVECFQRMMRERSFDR